MTAKQLKEYEAEQACKREVADSNVRWEIATCPGPGPHWTCCTCE